jgi:hypothetical protein
MPRTSPRRRKSLVAGPGRKRRRRKNKGWFRKGFDPRRYIFTLSDCRVGWWVANILHPELRDWLRMRLHCYYVARERARKEVEAILQKQLAECPF